MKIHKPIPANSDLAEQTLDLRRDPRNHRVIENEGQRRQEQGAQYDGDDDLDRVGDVKISALVGERHTGPEGQGVCLAVNMRHKLLHGTTSCECDI